MTYPHPTPGAPGEDVVTEEPRRMSRYWIGFMTGFSVCWIILALGYLAVR